MTGADARLREALADRYRIERELGRGGMATVYLAHDLKHDRLVALKVLDAEVTTPLASERFQREIRFAARLQHPHILPVHDSGEAAGRLWFSMPFVDGESLRARLRREARIPVPEAVRIAVDVARALDYAHRQGVIHRDIKPENILLTPDGDPLVADFGIGKALGGGTAATPGVAREQQGDRLTAVGQIPGTPPYMSLEQADEEPELDGRSDIYSLGVVLYEMLSGALPFPGRSLHAIVARQLTESPPPLCPACEGVSPELEGVVTRMLARERAERYATGGDVADALEAPPQTGPASPARPTRSPARWVAGAVAALAVAALAAGIYRWRGASPPGLDASVLAVAPFDVLDPRLVLWREGLVDLLSRNLDGAGPLRTVPPTVVIRRWAGRADPPSAGALGRRTGAGLVIYGALLGAGPDSARLRATLLDVGRGRALGEWEVAGSSDRVDRLADSLTVRLLSGLGRIRPIGAVRAPGFGATNLSALKAFLQGEQYLRRSEFDSALTAYQTAIDLDSNFAPALQRASIALGWVSGAFDSVVTDYALRAEGKNHGLSPRDSLFITAGAQLTALGDAGPLGVAADSGWPARLNRLFATVAYATTRYPDDPEAWFLLGDAQVHYGAFAGRSYQQQLQAFDRAIALDSAFTPPYVHPVEMSAPYGPDAMRRYLRPYLELAGNHSNAEWARLTERLLDSARTAAAVAPLLRNASDTVLIIVFNTLSRLPDSAELAVGLARFIGSRPRSAVQWEDSNFAKMQVARTLLSRGHLREGGELMSGQPRWQVYVDAALLGAIPAEQAAAVFRERLLGPASPQLVGAFPWWASHGDTTSLRRALARADSLARGDPDPNGRTRARYAAASAAAYGALARADTAAALERFRALPMETCPACYLDRLTLAQLLAEQGREGEAWRILQGEHPSSTLLPFPTEILWALLRGRVAERLGKLEPARQSYAWVAGMWRNSDPPLQPYVAEARAGLARLMAE